MSETFDDLIHETFDEQMPEITESMPERIGLLQNDIVESVCVVDNRYEVAHLNIENQLLNEGFDQLLPDNFYSKFEKKVACIKCNKKFRRYSSHLKRKCEGLVMYSCCNNCDESFRGARLLQYHVTYLCRGRQSSMSMFNENLNKFECLRCNSYFTKVAAVQKHIINKCATPKHNRYCDKCGELFGKKGPVKHLDECLATQEVPTTAPFNERVQKFECNSCGGYFIHYFHLVQHKRKACCRDDSIHCDVCGKKFMEKMALSRHIKKCSDNGEMESLHGVLQLNDTVVISKEAAGQRDLMEKLQRNVNMGKIFDHARTLLEMELITAKQFGVAMLLLGKMLIRIHGQECSSSVFTLKRRHFKVLDEQTFEVKCFYAG